MTTNDTTTPTTPTAPTAGRAPAPAEAGAPDVEFVLPAYNEEEEIGLAISGLARWLYRNAAWTWRITVADNASTDGTLKLARRAALADPAHVGVAHLDEKGRGRALRRTWMASQARVVAYMDVDLSAGLDALPALIDPLLADEADLALGSRLMRGSRVQRCLKREAISRCYNLLLNLSFGYGVHDAQCGFKAMRTDVARCVLPSVENDNWFFDTELLVVSHEAGLRLREVPVEWREDPGTTVDIPKTVAEDLAGIRRLRRRQREGALEPRALLGRSLSWEGR